MSQQLRIAETLKGTVHIACVSHVRKTKNAPCCVVLKFAEVHRTDVKLLSKCACVRVVILIFFFAYLRAVIGLSTRTFNSKSFHLKAILTFPRLGVIFVKGENKLKFTIWFIHDFCLFYHQNVCQAKAVSSSLMVVIGL